MKSGLVVLVGRSNVGKSTLLNTLVGTKIAATSFRAQMTRHIIHGVMNVPGSNAFDKGQAVFVDTPGVFRDRKNPLTAKLINKIKDAIQDIDIIVYVVDPTREIGEEERHIFGLIRHLSIPKILVINKSDLPHRDKKYLPDYRLWSKEFEDVFELSALRGGHITPLKNKVIELLPEGVELYPEEQLTNITNSFWIAEIIREKVFSVFDKEVPYSITVEVDDIEETTFGKEKNLGLRISARILTNEDRYKPIIIGKGGRRLKEIGQMARKELEQSTNYKVFLELDVEVDQHWISRI